MDKSEGENARYLVGLQNAGYLKVAKQLESVFQNIEKLFKGGLRKMCMCLGISYCKAKMVLVFQDEAKQKSEQRKNQNINLGSYLH